MQDTSESCSKFKYYMVIVTDQFQSKGAFIRSSGLRLKRYSVQAFFCFSLIDYESMVTMSEL